MLYKNMTKVYSCSDPLYPQWNHKDFSRYIKLVAINVLKHWPKLIPEKISQKCTSSLSRYGCMVAIALVISLGSSLVSSSRNAPQFLAAPCSVPAPAFSSSDDANASAISRTYKKILQAFLSIFLCPIGQNIILKPKTCELVPFVVQMYQSKILWSAVLLLRK